MTTYDDHDTYQAGDSWDYNDEMGELFEKKFERGPVSNRPSASSAPDNAVWHATDQGLIYENEPNNGWTVTGHGSPNDKVPEGHFESATIGGVKTQRGGGSTTFYVDQVNGDDSNDGKTASTAFASYPRAIEEVPRFPDSQVEIRQIGDYSVSSPVKIKNRKGTIDQAGKFHLRIVGDSEIDPLQESDPSNMETFDGAFHIEGSNGVKIQNLNIDGLPWVISSVGVTIFNCYLEGSFYFVYFRSGELTIISNVFDGQSNDPGNGVVGLRNGQASLNQGNEIRNWDYQNNTFLWAYQGTSIIDGLNEKYPDAGRKGDITPESGRGIADAAFDRSLEQKTISGLRQVSNASASELDSGEPVFDDNRGGSGNAAWLFKDSSGTLHYKDFDGTV